MYVDFNKFVKYKQEFTYCFRKKTNAKIWISFDTSSNLTKSLHQKCKLVASNVCI